MTWARLGRRDGSKGACPLTRSIYAGVFFVTLGTLMYQILLPRIFSVTMFYHFAFMAVSLAMFGLTAGAVLVYLKAERFTAESAPRDLAAASAVFAITSVAALWAYLHLPILESGELAALPLVAASYLLISVPFAASGVAVAIALTRFPAVVGRVYAADLVGAAAGALLIIAVLERTDALTAVVVVASLVMVGAAWFSLGVPDPRWQIGTWIAAAILGGAALGHHHLAQAGRPVLRLVHRAFPDTPRLYERWNSYSYVEVMDPGAPSTGAALGWGMSPKLPPSAAVRQLSMNVDIKAGTPITSFDGDLGKLEFLRFDVTNAVHHVRRDADVCVIGAGGGRDVLSALYFDQRSVLGIELNQNVLGAVTGPFRDFAGRLDEHPKVELVVDEARSHLARTDRRFDVLQISLIDTFAATAAGAFVLAENSLYTVEAWELFLERLAPGGVLTVSRYYYHQRPAEAYRTVALGVAALARRGVVDPRPHLVMVKNASSYLAGASGIGTLLVARDPWSPEDLRRLDRYARDLDLETVLSPTSAADEVLETIARGGDLDRFYEGLPVDVSPPTDDRPFFFQMLRLRDVARSDLFDTADVNWKNVKAILVLVVLLALVLVLGTVSVVVPVLRTADRDSIRRGRSWLLYFGAIGFAYLFIEMAMMQRLMVYLGHPTYALSVVLFTLLLSSGAGSFLADRLAERRGPERLRGVLVALCGVAAGIGVAAPWAMRALDDAPTAGRVALAVVLLAPVGALMGMPFPLGMKRAAAVEPRLGPWLWGINGAASVCATVLAVTVALGAGIGASYWIGVACYVAALALYARAPAPPLGPPAEGRAAQGG